MHLNTRPVAPACTADHPPAPCAPQDEAYLGENPMMASLDALDQVEVADRMHLLHYYLRSGTVLGRKGERMAGVYMVVEGAMISSQGRKYGRGGIAGQMRVLYQ